MGGIDSGNEVKQLKLGPITIGYRRRALNASGQLRCFEDQRAALADFCGALEQDGLWWLPRYLVGLAEKISRAIRARRGGDGRMC